MHKPQTRTDSGEFGSPDFQPSTNRKSVVLFYVWVSSLRSGVPGWVVYGARFHQPPTLVSTDRGGHQTQL